MNQPTILSKIRTPFDEIIPEVDEPSAQFYLDAMRIYLGLSSGTLSYEDALDAAEILKNNPEYTRSPSNPVQLPINEHYTSRILENLKTLSKFNLVNAESIRSAYSFAFLMPEAPISSIDYKTLKYLSENPRTPIVKIADALESTPRTINRSIDRLSERHDVRFRALLDETIWGLNRILVFFKPKNELDWLSIEDQLITYPFLKTMLKTTMSDLGYISVIVPGNQGNISSFIKSIKRISSQVFDYTSIHHEEAVGVDCNLSLLKDSKWDFPHQIEVYIEGEVPPHLRVPNMIPTRGRNTSYTRMEYEVASTLKISSRLSPSHLNQILQRRNQNLGPKKIASIIRKLYRNNLVLPYTAFGLGLTSSLCFEIVCDEIWKNKIASLLGMLPHTFYLVSDRGIILWILIPGYNQVEYYRFFRNLESHEGVESVESIMTISRKGSKSILDLTDELKFGKDGFSTSPSSLDITQYITDF